MITQDEHTAATTEQPHHFHNPHRYSLSPRQFLKRADPKLTHPTVLAHAKHRASDIQLRIADAITAFAGSMWFIYIHIVIFVVWMVWFESNPWPMLTLVVSLEAIFLSTFVMIGQNRQAAFQQEKADRDYQEQEMLLVENTKLTRLIYQLSDDIDKQIATEVSAQLRAINEKQDIQNLKTIDPSVSRSTDATK